MLLAVLETPEPLGDAHLAGVAAGLGLALADVRMRLAGPRPRVFLQEEDAARVEAAKDLLHSHGWRVQAFDVAAVPSDAERVFVRRWEWLHASHGPPTLRAFDDAGEAHDVTSADVALLQRAVRSQQLTRETKVVERRFAPARALLSGGLLLTKKVERTTVQSTEKEEAFLVLHRRSGDDLAFYERSLDFRSLGPALQPSSQANFTQLTTELRQRFPKAAFDERARRPATLGLHGRSGVDPTDLALFLIALSHATAALDPRPALSR